MVLPSAFIVCSLFCLVARSSSSLWKSKHKISATLYNQHSSSRPRLSTQVFFYVTSQCYVSSAHLIPSLFPLFSCKQNDFQVLILSLQRTEKIVVTLSKSNEQLACRICFLQLPSTKS